MLLLALAAASCSDDDPEVLVRDKFETVADGKIWKIQSRTFFNSDGKEFLLRIDGGEVPSVSGENDGFYFNGNEIVVFYHRSDGAGPWWHHYVRGNFTYDESSGWLVTDRSIIDYPAHPDYHKKIWIESVSPEQIVIRMCFGCLWGNFPDRDKTNPNYSSCDEGSYMRCVLTPVENPQEWWDLFEEYL